MHRVATLIAHVLATTSVVACGGTVTETPDPTDPGTSPTTTTTTSPTSVPPTTPTTTPPTPGRDAGLPPKVDAGCTTPPIRQGNTCADVFYHPCGVPAGVDPTDGMSQAECNIVCSDPRAKPGQYWGCGVHLKDDLPGPSFDCYTCVDGRRPEGYVEHANDGTVAGWLGHAADLERVSIDAFQILQRELRHHGAPSDLVLAAERAEADEVRHARVLGTLAVREGATLSDVPVIHGSPRELIDIALENAVEGCIRETYGAVVAGYQAEHASRLDVRRLMGAIYRDETAHAELAWQVHAWILPQLTRDERARLDAKMSDAATELVRSSAVVVPWEQRDALGIPSPTDARKLVRGLRAHVWMPALAA